MYRVKEESSLLTFLKGKTDLSGREIKRALESGGCRLNGKLERFASTKLKEGDKVTFHLPKVLKKETLSILYQDPSLTLFNKPSGVTTAPEVGHHLVHRLDKGTSGVLLMARTLPMKKDLEALFKKREVKKTYIALIKGAPRKDQGTIDNRLSKKGTFHGQTLYGSAPNGQKAITHWKVLEKKRESPLSSSTLKQDAPINSVSIWQKWDTRSLETSSMGATCHFLKLSIVFVFMLIASHLSTQRHKKKCRQHHLCLHYLNIDLNIKFKL